MKVTFEAQGGFLGSMNTWKFIYPSIYFCLGLHPHNPAVSVTAHDFPPPPIMCLKTAFDCPFCAPYSVRVSPHQPCTGWTVYLERRILGRLYGQSVMQFNAAQGRQGMHEAVELFGASHGFTALCPDLTVEGGVDPDDAFSRIPYEKGFHLIYHLQVCRCHAQQHLQHHSQHHSQQHRNNTHNLPTWCRSWLVGRRHSHRLCVRMCSAFGFPR